MDLAELTALLADLRRLGSDHSTCEVKKAQGGLPATTWESICAFANAQGGWFILGVSETDDFSIVGVRDARAMESQLGAICSELEPPVRCAIETVDADGKSVVTCFVPPLPKDQRPCYKKDRGPWAGSRIRVGDGDRRLTDYEVSVLLANRTETRHDQTPVARASVDDLDQELIKGFLRRVRDTKGEIFSKVSDEKALTMLNVLSLHGDRLVPTMAGLLTFGIYPQTYEPQLDITFVAYPASEPGVLGHVGERFTENRAIDGPIPAMVAECIRVLKRNMKRRSIVSGIYRVDEWEYPEEVLREALVNALVHRDYSEFARGMQVQVEMYPDRLLIRNPGGLYGPVEVGELGTSTVSSSRNKALLKILEDTPFGDGHMVCENRGSGITRIRVALTEAGMEPPKFTDDISSFVAEFPNHTLLDKEALEWLQSLDTRPLTRSQMTALVMMRNGKVLTNGTYREATGMRDRAAVGRELKDLVDRALIEQIGTRGGATYRLPGELPSEQEPLFPTQGAAALAVPTTLEEATPADRALTTDLQQTVLDAIGMDNVSRAEIQERTGLEYHQVIGALQSLREKGYVVMVGRPRSKKTTWRAV